MTDCKGLFGKWFGHEFHKYMIKDPAILYKLTNVSMSDETVKNMLENSFTRYEIRCKRCGCKTDD